MSRFVSVTVGKQRHKQYLVSLNGRGGRGGQGGRGWGQDKGMGMGKRDGYLRVPFDLGSGIHMVHVALLWAWSSPLENASKYKHILLIRCTIIGLMAFMLSKDYVQSVSFQTQKNLALYKKLG